MKLSPLLLAGSLAANAVLLALYLGKTPSDAPSAAALPAGSNAPKSSASAPDAGQSALFATAWAELHSGDPAALSARLRAAGLSPTTIRSIVAAQGLRSSSPPAEAAALAAKRAALAANLAALQAKSREFERSRYGDLPHEKVREIQKIEADYSAVALDIRAKAPGTLLQEDCEQLAYLEKEKLADLAKALTPEQLEDYQLRTNPTAVTLRYLRDQAVGFHATDEEFRAIYRAAVAADAQYGSVLNSTGSIDSYQKRNESINAQLEQVLSPERFTDFKRATDPTYKQLNSLATRLELPAEVPQQLVALQTDFQQRANAIRINSRVPAETRNTQLAALAEEAATKLTAVLTPRGFEAYQKERSGSWLNLLAPRPPPAPPKS